MTTPEEAIEVLNRIHEADPTVMPALIQLRVPCNEAVADDPTVQVYGGTGMEPTVGILGVLNGVFGCRPETTRGYIGAQYAPNGELIGFVLTETGRRV
jgi:hypothetical protein